MVKVAAARANELQKPWVLDPVAVGATRFRTEKCIELIHLKPAVIRGNASEIMAVVGASAGSTKVHNASVDQGSLYCSVYAMLDICTSNKSSNPSERMMQVGRDGSSASL